MCIVGFCYRRLYSVQSTDLWVAREERARGGSTQNAHVYDVVVRVIDVSPSLEGFYLPYVCVATDVCVVLQCVLFLVSVSCLSVTTVSSGVEA